MSKVRVNCANALENILSNLTVNIFLIMNESFEYNIEEKRQLQKANSIIFTLHLKTCKNDIVQYIV